MATESFYTDMVIDTPEAAKALAELLDSDGTFVQTHYEFVIGDPAKLEELKKHMREMHRLIASSRRITLPPL